MRTLTPGTVVRLALHGIQFIAMMYREPAPATRCCPRYLSGSSVTTTTRLAPSAATWAAHLTGTVSVAVVMLAAGHRDRIVVEDLVGDMLTLGRRMAARMAR